MLNELGLCDNVGITLFNSFFGKSNSAINFDLAAFTAIFREVKFAGRAFDARKLQSSYIQSKRMVNSKRYCDCTDQYSNLSGRMTGAIKVQPKMP